MISALEVDNDVGRAMVQWCDLRCSIAAGRRRWREGAAAAEMSFLVMAVDSEIDGSYTCGHRTNCSVPACIAEAISTPTHVR
jgi:hypothetical protein